MLNLDTARKIGIDACIDKLGRDFVIANQDNASSGYGETEEGMYCVVCVTDEPGPELPPGVLQLDGGPPWKYRASCIVNLENGALTFMDVVCPSL